MSFPAHYLETLEFPKIRALLDRETSFSASSELALALEPTTFPDLIRHSQDATEEARRLLELRPGWAPRGAYDLRPLAHHAALGGVLQLDELLQVATTLAAARATRNLLNRPEFSLPTLSAYARVITDEGTLEREIRQTMNDDGQILDSASGRLSAIRIQLRTAHDRLLRRLNELMARASVREALQEPILTQRGGRYVIPVKSDFRGRVPGIVHDQSASGQTVFIEPLAVVDLANEWRRLGLEEEHEIARILRDLSAQVGAQADLLSDAVDALAQIDLALAKGKLAQEMRATRPRILAPLSVEEAVGSAKSPAPSPESADKSPLWGMPGRVEVGGNELQPSRPPLRLLQACHPLLHGDVVPIDVELGGAFDVLLISGPNTGGKTVALKTVGLLAIMAQAGLQIPAASGSEVPVYSGIYADIGDEQSIEQSLSTFSAHIARIIDILKIADEGSLVLLDEVGAGTDPQEGSALGHALLLHLARAGISTIATTHSSDLKVFAASTPRVKNASVEFDIETLRPTYRLIIGLPGQSNALTIAERLGMDSTLVNEARRYLAPADRQAHALLSQVQTQLTEARADRADAARHRVEADQQAGVLAAKLASIEQERQQVLEGAEEEAARVLSELQAEADNLRRELRTLRARQRQPAPIEKRLTELAAVQAGRRAAADGGHSFGVGDVVEVGPLASTGQVRALSDDGQTAEVEVRGMRVHVPMAHLRPGQARRLRDADERTWSRITEQAIARTSPGQIEAEIDLRGLTSDEARQRLDQHLSDAVLTGVGTLRVIHGKGTGVLRETVREVLSNHPLVRAYRSADAREGGDGATLADLTV